MKSLKCKWLTIYYNIVLFKDVFMKGMIADGHNWKYTGEMCEYHWIMECTRCGAKAGSEIGPDAEIEEL